MTAKDQELLRKLLATFKIEADEHITAISSGLVELEKAASPERQLETIEVVFREAHSLKGAARAVNLVKVEAVCQSLESVFSGLKTQKTPLSPGLLDRLHQTVDNLGTLLSAALDESASLNKFEDPQTPETPDLLLKAPVTPSKQQQPNPVGGMSSSRHEQTAQQQRAESIPVQRPWAEGQGLAETVRLSTRKVDSLLRQAEELISTKATGSHRLTQLREANATVALWEREWGKVRPQIRAVELSSERESKVNGQSRVSNMLSPGASLLAFLGRNERNLQSIKTRLATLTKDLDNDHRTLSRQVDDLLEETKRASMLPFSSLLGLFPKLVRDLCRDCGKDAELAIVGAEMEADRRILEEMKDPLIHLVRNCIDHGIENPTERGKRQKSLRATITIAISSKSGGKVEIAVSDDGTGIDIQRVCAAAVGSGVISNDDVEKMDDREALSLVFRSGISTSPMITEVSGRGLGLAIVQEKAEKVGGTVSVETQPGVGTFFRLTLPLTLATFQGILVRAGEHLFVLPTMYVQRVLRVGWDEIKTVENRETLQINGRAVALVRLLDVLGIPERGPAPDRKRKLPIVLLTWAGEQLAFVVNEILNGQEVLVKGLGKQFPRVRNIAGATILGTGKVVPVLNVSDLVRSAVSTVPAAPTHENEEERKRVLVAEDSITARTLLKAILESAGYRVRTAVDGAEAFSALGSEAFDLVVSDVEMPRMSGFDLTAKIRADRKLSELPVVLVTALESREDRERGVDVGANAYIVKSSFDQSNLIEVVQRLI